MAQRNKKAEKHIAPVTTAPVEATAPVTTAAPVEGTAVEGAAPVTTAKVLRYANAASISNMAAVITAIPNPKVPGKKSHGRYAKFYTPGVTVGEFIASYKAAGYSTTLARADLRWDLQHGFITLS
jgi:hypothetical protein